ITTTLDSRGATVAARKRRCAWRTPERTMPTPYNTIWGAKTTSIDAMRSVEPEQLRLSTSNIDNGPAAAGPLSMLLVDSRSCSGSTDLMASMLVVFAPQMVLYGVGIVLSGVLQAHRRFLAATVAPLLSSVVVMATYLLYATLAHGHGNDLARLPVSASTALAAGTTLGVVAL